MTFQYTPCARSGDLPGKLHSHPIWKADEKNKVVIRKAQVNRIRLDSVPFLPAKTRS